MKKIACLLVIIAILFSSVNIAASYQIYKKEENNNLNRFDYDQKYAVIIVGTYGANNQEKITTSPRESYYEWYTNSAGRRFRILNEAYGFPCENIYLLITEVHEEGYNPGSNYVGIKHKFIHVFNATSQNITKIFDHNISEKITENDLLIVDLIGHGGDDGSIPIPIYSKRTGKTWDKDKGIDASDTYMALEKPASERSRNRIRFIDFPSILRNSLLGYNRYSSNLTTFDDKDYRLYDWELRYLTFQLDARRIIFILQPCHSGGFINDLSKSNHVIIAAADEGELAGDFSGPFNDGMEYYGSGTDNNPKDGFISLAEAFSYVQTHKKEYYPNIHVLIDDNGDKKGSIDLNGLDGRISANIFNLTYEMELIQ